MSQSATEMVDNLMQMMNGEFQPTYDIPCIHDLHIDVATTSHEEIMRLFNDSSTDYSIVHWSPTAHEFGNKALMHTYQKYSERQEAKKKSDYRIETEMLIHTMHAYIAKKAGVICEQIKAPVSVTQCVEMLKNVLRENAKRNHETNKYKCVATIGISN
jgi:hypothetical protein